MSYNPTGVPYRKIGLDAQDLTVPPYGGDVMQYTAEAALLIGDVVYFTVANNVNKSSTAADYAAFAGVVVGGDSFNGMIVADDPTNCIGQNAAAAGGKVWVQYNGIAPVVSAAALVIHTRLQVATTAGRVDDAAFVAGQTVGIALATAGGASVTIPMLIQPK